MKSAIYDNTDGPQGYQAKRYTSGRGRQIPKPNKQQLKEKQKNK